MGCIKVKQFSEFLISTLKLAVKDEDSYVRKTAALCLMKLFEFQPEIMEEQGMMQQLDQLVNDGNAMVVSNALVVQMMISVSKGVNVMNLTPKVVQKMLIAINECNE